MENKGFENPINLQERTTEPEIKNAQRLESTLSEIHAWILREVQPKYKALLTTIREMESTTDPNLMGQVIKSRKALAEALGENNLTLQLEKFEISPELIKYANSKGADIVLLLKKLIIEKPDHLHPIALEKYIKELIKTKIFVYNFISLLKTPPKEKTIPTSPKEDDEFGADLVD